MKKTILILTLVLVLVLTMSTMALAHPKGPPGMPGQSIGGLHTAVVEVYDLGGAPGHVVYELLHLAAGFCHIGR